MTEKDQREKIIPTAILPAEILDQLHALQTKVETLEASFKELTDALIQGGVIKRVKE